LSRPAAGVHGLQRSGAYNPGLLKGKVLTGVIGIFISVVALIGAIRLAKPGSWWAEHRYATRPDLARRAASRHQRQEERWNRLRDLVAGAPSPVSRSEVSDPLP
jgi:hypothetical protein